MPLPKAAPVSPESNALRLTRLERDVAQMKRDVSEIKKFQISLMAKTDRLLALAEAGKKEADGKKAATEKSWQEAECIAFNTTRGKFLFRPDPGNPYAPPQVVVFLPDRSWEWKSVTDGCQRDGPANGEFDGWHHVWFNGSKPVAARDEIPRILEKIDEYASWKEKLAKKK
ncbi:MAG: hypothetical protein PHI23_03860 [Candidatus Peribacteraceae bacterium]|nr:hypothetical protein [Candidatus Peribacteraceae bacterium]